MSLTVAIFLESYPKFRKIETLDTQRINTTNASADAKLKYIFLNYGNFVTTNSTVNVEENIYKPLIIDKSLSVCCDNRTYQKN